MKFTNDANIHMTAFRGYVIARYDELVGAFGEPDDGPDADLDKVTCCWRLQFEDGVVVSIYDWKEQQTPYQRYDWHIGSKAQYASESVERVHQILDQYRKQQEVLRVVFKKQDERLGCKSTTPPELVALFKTKLENL